MQNESGNLSIFTLLRALYSQKISGSYSLGSIVWSHLRNIEMQTVYDLSMHLIVNSIESKYVFYG